MQSFASTSSSRCQAFRPALAPQAQIYRSQCLKRKGPAVRALPEALLFDCDGVGVLLLLHLCWGQERHLWGCDRLQRVCEVMVLH